MFRSSTDVMIPAKRENDDENTSSLYYCNFCSAGWGSETEVELHRAEDHTETVASLFRSTDKHVCKMCIMEFDSEDAVIRHIKSEHLLSSETAIRVEREIFICETCGELFFNKLLLAHHIAYVHRKKDGKYRFKCPTCYKMVRILNSWYHFRGHKLQSIAACKICCVKYKDRKQLAEHLKSHKRYYKCELCGFVTKKEENFNTHINSVHKTPNEKASRMKSAAYSINLFMPRVYPIIWKKQNLMGWRGVKLTNKVHICILCREICLDEESMIHHTYVEHEDKETTATNYTCPCGMSFTNKVLLKHHLFKFKDLHNA